MKRLEEPAAAPGGLTQASLRGQVRRLAQASPSAWDKDKDLESAVTDFKVRKQTWTAFWGLAYRAVGVVYGDLGTSPLYTYPTVFVREPSRLAIYGSCSLILWILMLQLVVKYVCVMLYADDNGEGGTFALYSLLCRHIGITPYGKREASDSSLHDFPASPVGQRERKRLGARLASHVKASPRTQQAVLLLVFLGTSMLLGDGVLTCAIEVTSAVAGLEMKVGVSQGVIVGVSCAILCLLFSVQWLGTSRIGALFSPVLLTWFAANAVLGIYNIAKYDPGIMAAFNPAYGFRYLVREGVDAWISLGGIILCVTGAESMFNDMGHFSRAAIQATTLAIVMPSCMLTYLGEAAYLTRHPGAFGNPYFAAIPARLFWPVFVLATAASVVAAQSLITATFSIVQQSVALNCFPPVKIVRTSRTVAGQVYLPAVNWALMVGSIAVVGAFQTTSRIGNAFGVAFISVMMVSTVLVTLVQLIVWRMRAWLPLAFCAFFLALEGVPASALLYKVPHGAWFPLALALAIISVSYLWHYGCSQRLAYTLSHAPQLSSLLRQDPDSRDGGLVLRQQERRVGRLPGLALYYSEDFRGLPEAFVRLLAKLPAAHRTVVFITVPLPTTTPDERFLIRSLQLPGFFRVVARYGYQDLVDHGPEFVADLTTRIAALVRYNSLMGGGVGAMADSAAEIERRATASAAGPSAAAEKPLAAVEPRGGRGSRAEVAAAHADGEEASWDRCRPSQKASQAESSGTVDEAGESCSQGAATGASSSMCEGRANGKDAMHMMHAAPPDAPGTDAASLVLRAQGEGVMYALSKAALRAAPGSGFARRLALEALYPLLLRNSRAPSASWRIPAADVIEVGVIHEA